MPPLRGGRRAKRADPREESLPLPSKHEIEPAVLIDCLDTVLAPAQPPHTSPRTRRPIRPSSETAQAEQGLPTDSGGPSSASFTGELVHPFFLHGRHNNFCVWHFVYFAHLTHSLAPLSAPLCGSRMKNAANNQREEGGRQRSELAKIHLAKKRLALDEETYRATIARVCGGKTSARRPRRRRARQAARRIQTLRIHRGG